MRVHMREIDPHSRSNVHLYGVKEEEQRTTRNMSA